MTKISELSETRIGLEDVVYFTDNKCNPRNSTLSEIMDKYAIAFAVFVHNRNAYLDNDTLKELLKEMLKEFKDQYSDK
jgi:hypothetical protein